MYKMNMKDSLRQVSYHFNFRFTSHGKVYIKHFQQFSAHELKGYQA